jgi:hypothetical protein
MNVKNIDTPQPSNKFSYKIDFKHKKFDKDLKATNFIESILIVTLDEPIPEPMQRNWISIIQELNPNYFQIEIINVQESWE